MAEKKVKEGGLLLVLFLRTVDEEEQSTIEVQVDANPSKIDDDDRVKLASELRKIADEVQVGEYRDD